MEWEGREPTINSPPHSPYIQTEFMRKSSSSGKSVANGGEDMILPSVEDPCYSMDPRHLGQSK